MSTLIQDSSLRGVTPADRRRRRIRPTPNGIPVAAGGGASDSYCVSTVDLAHFLEPLIAEENARLASTELKSVSWDDEKAANAGAVEIIAASAALTLDFRPEAVVRRLYAIRSFEQRSVNTGVADAILMALNVHIEHLDLAVFPRGKDSAREMVDCHFEFVEHDWKPTALEKQRLARMLLSFTKGYIADNSDEPLDTEEYARNVATARLKEWRRSPDGEAFYRLHNRPNPAREYLNDAA